MKQSLSAPDTDQSMRYAFPNTPTNAEDNRTGWQSLRTGPSGTNPFGSDPHTVVNSDVTYQDDGTDVDLIVVDSFSRDNTGRIAEETLVSSVIPKDRWKLIRVEKPGKCHAINVAMEQIESEVIVISDADAIVAEGWFEIIRDALASEEIGAISGVENVETIRTGKFERYYRMKSNQLRVKESKMDSTPILEGSILAWKRKVAMDFKFDESSNADDAQISLQIIKSGLRSVVSPDVSFHSSRKLGSFFQKSIRRSQGLSRALIKNWRLCFSAPRKGARVAIIASIATYVFFPWFLFLFLINTILAMSMWGVGNFYWPYLSSAMAIYLLVSPQGRFVLTGMVVSISAHLQHIFGIRYSNWDPE